MDTSELRAKAVAVLVARENAAEARDEIKDIERQHRASYEARAQAIKAETAAMEAAREARLVHYFETGELGEVFGLSIQMRQGWSYDPNEALQWLITHRPDLLTFDRKLFEAVAFAGQKTGDRSLDFVVQGKEPVATVAGDERLAAVIHGDDVEAAIAAGEIKP